MKDCYTNSKSDLFAAFIERCTDFAQRGGAAAMITMQSWMFLSSFEKLRSSLLRHQQISSMLHLGTRAFDSIGGEVVSSTAFVLANDPGRRAGSFVRLVDGNSEAEKSAALTSALATQTREVAYYRASSSDFGTVPGSPITYWLSEKMRRVFADSANIGEHFDAIAGISTGDNGRFFRYWYEVSADRILGDSEEAPWAPHHKGGASRKWAGNVEHVLRYSGSSVHQMKLLPGFRHDGSSDYFKRHVGWSALTSGPPSFRWIPAGSTFGSGSKALMISGDTAMAQIAVLNSALALSLLNALSPTMNYEVGHILNLPISPSSVGGELLSRASSLIAESQHDWDEAETSFGFEVDPLVIVARE